MAECCAACIVLLLISILMHVPMCRFMPAERQPESARFTSKAKLFQVISDYPGWAQQNRHAKQPSFVGACYLCHQAGHHCCGKTIYSGAR